MLLIACANVANLLLARAVARRDADGRAAGDRRVARGRSSRRRSSKASCSPSAAASPGCVVAIGAARLLLVARVQPHAASCRSARGRRRSVLAFAFGLALVTGIVFGAAPAWFATRTDPIDALRGVGPQHAAIIRRSRARRC